MVRIVALHGIPNDAEAFERHYREIHTPLVQRLPGVRNYRFGRVIRTSDGSGPPYFMVSDTYFDDIEALEAALDSPEMAEAMADVPNFATGGVTILFCESEDFPPIANGS
jgi:uncharacterized protein (TIGR02118 family)